MNDVICRHCQTSNPAGSKFCGGCGASLLMQPMKGEGRTVCRFCGTAQPAAYRHCAKCGKPLHDEGTEKAEADDSAFRKEAAAPAEPTSAEQPVFVPTPLHQTPYDKTSYAQTPTAPITPRPAVTKQAPYSGNPFERTPTGPAVTKQTLHNDNLFERTPTGPAPTGKRKGAWLWIGLGAGVLLAVAATLTWFLLLKPEGEPGASSEPQGTNVTASAEQGGKNPQTAATTAPQTDSPTRTPTTETEAPETLLTADEAKSLVTQKYVCRIKDVAEEPDVFVLMCLYPDQDAEYGTVMVDKRTGELTILNGMTPDAVQRIEETKIQQIVKSKSTAASYSFGIINLKTGYFVGSQNSDRPMSSSVLINIPILHTVNGMIQSGECSLNTGVPIHVTVGGRGELTAADDGTQKTVNELLKIMFRSSDNNATNSFMDYLSIDQINRRAHQAGFSSVDVNNHIGETKDYTANDNYVSAQDLCRMLYELYSGYGVIDKDYMLQNLALNDGTQKSGLFRHLGADRFLTFNAVKSDKYNEILVFEKGSAAYAVAFLSNHEKLETLKEASAAISEYLADVLK